MAPEGGIPVTETRYIRYVATNSYRHVTEPLDSKTILRLEARRTFGENKGHSQPLPYMNVKLFETVDVGIDYLSSNGYPFSKKGIADFIDSSDGLVDLPVQRLDVLAGSGPIGAALAELRGDRAIRDLEWVAMFEEFPLRRELEENDYTSVVRSQFALEDLGKIGFEPASLDLANVLPLEVWRTVVKYRLSRDLKGQIESWAASLQNLENSAVRKFALSMFPKDICNGRVYERLRGNIWKLTRNGDI
jgi:hypothetical protein